MRLLRSHAHPHLLEQGTPTIRRGIAVHSFLAAGLLAAAQVTVTIPADTLAYAIAL